MGAHGRLAHMGETESENMKFDTEMCGTATTTTTTKWKEENKN